MKSTNNLVDLHIMQIMENKAGFDPEWRITIFWVNINKLLAVRQS